MRNGTPKIQAEEPNRRSKHRLNVQLKSANGHIKTRSFVTATTVLCLCILQSSCSAESSTHASQLTQQRLAQAEALIDAFYSFDPAQLAPLLDNAPSSRNHILYYQGWAEGGNYRVLQRKPCTTAEHSETVTCAITVEDDPVLALKTDFKVTDTFAITFEQDKLVSVETSSNDQPIYYQARDWVLKEMPQIMTGPCKGFFNDGPTPAECARAITAGYRKFAQSEEFRVSSESE